MRYGTSPTVRLMRRGSVVSRSRGNETRRVLTATGRPVGSGIEGTTGS